MLLAMFKIEIEKSKAKSVQEIQKSNFKKEEEFKSKFKVLNKFNSKLKANNVTNK
jgi:hypothetical protein